jgi:hypothetical protein
LDWNNDGFTLKVEGLNGTKFSETTQLLFNSKKFSALIQTDKNFYKASDKIQFRVLILDGETRPYDMTNEIVEVFIADPKNNRIKQWKNIELKNGVFKGELKLSSEPTLGHCNIQVLSAGSVREVITKNKHQ